VADSLAGACDEAKAAFRAAWERQSQERERPCMPNLHVPDYLILPFGRAIKSDLQKIMLSAVSADGLYFSTDVPVIFIRKSDRQPICLSEFGRHFGGTPDRFLGNPPEKHLGDDRSMLEHICGTLKSHNPNMTQWEELFLDLYFSTLANLVVYAHCGVRAYNEHFRGPHADDSEALETAWDKIGITSDWRWCNSYDSPKDVWRALLPIPELQLYVQDPLAETDSYEPDNNFRVDYGFWNGEKLIAVEIDGADPAGYARDIRRDRLLRRAGVEVIHILNLELAKHKAHALVQLLPAQFFGFNWNYEGKRPEYEGP
jgi:hypothetical protein